MGNNFFIPWSATPFTATGMNGPLITLDRIITRIKDVFISCDGSMSYTPSTTVLAWTGDIIIHYVDADGELIQNIIDFTDEQNIDITTGYYVYVDLDVADTELVPAQANLVKDAPATSIPWNRLVLGYTDDNDAFQPSPAFAQVFLQQGRLQQTVASSATPTINWSLGKTAHITPAVNVTASTFTNITDGEIYFLEIENDVTGHTWVWDVNIQWAGGSAPTVSSGPSEIDIYEFVQIDSVVHGRIFSQISS